MAGKLYEAMFVVDANKGGAAFPETIRHIANLLTRSGAQIQRIEKWEERKLAYPIRHIKRGIYILVYFMADASAIRDMRRVIELSEQVLRVLILKAEQLSPVKGQLFTPAGEVMTPAPAASPAAVAEGPREQPASEPVEAEEAAKVEEKI